MDEKKRIRRNKEAIILLFSSDDKEVMRGLKMVRDHGDPSSIRPMLDVHRSTTSDAVRAEVEAILQSLKTESVVDTLVEALSSDDYVDQRAVILSGLWHSGLFPNEHVDTIVRVAIQGDFMTAIEATTVVENMEPPFEYEALEEASLSLQEYLDEEPGEDKTELIRSLQGIISGFQTAVDY